MAFIEVRDVTKTYKMGEVEIKAVDEIGFGIDKGEFVVIVGPSGAGKRRYLTFSAEWTPLRPARFTLTM